MKKGLVEALRWVAVLPAAIIGAVIITLISRIVDHLISPVEYNSGINGIITDFISGGIMGFVFVMIGTFVAPKYSKITSIVLATLGVCYCIAILSFRVFYTHEYDIRTIVLLLSAAVGCIAGAVHLHKNNYDF